MDEDYQRDQELRDRQGGRTFRVGKVLRGTYDQREDELEPQITRLMLELTHLPYEDEDKPARPAEVSRPAAEPSLLHRIAQRLHLR